MDPGPAGGCYIIPIAVEFPKEGAGPMSAERTEIPAPTEWHPDQLWKLIDPLESIRSEMAGLESALSERWRDIHPSQIPSSANLMHYVASKKRSMLRRLRWWSKAKTPVKE